MELYGSALHGFDADEQLCFVTANYMDFSAWKATAEFRLDPAELFDGPRSRYVYGMDGLRTVLAADFGEEFEELAEEVHMVYEEPRTFGEILDHPAAVS